MARSLRIEYEGAWYHVMNRGAGKKNIFGNAQHHRMFLNLLEEIHNKYQIYIHAYCLMPNHYHLLLNTPLANLSRAMRHLDGIYTQRYNKSQKSDGPLFRGRFKSILIGEENYLLRLSRYIHLNPVVSNIVKKPEKYHWSSYTMYLNNNPPHWLTTNFILNLFGPNMQKQKYQAFVAEGLDKELDLFFKKLKRLPILGTDVFIKTVSQKYLQRKNISREIPEQKYLDNLNLPTILDIMRIVADHYKININSLKYNQRKDNNNIPRNIAIYLACQLSGKTLQLIADQFGVSYHGISKSFRRTKTKIKQKDKFANEINSIKTKIKKAMSYV